VWQALYEELVSDGLEIVTVALDTNREAARPFVEAARPTHPSLVDEALSMVDGFGITNVPFALWIDEGGTIVRPAEVAFAQPAEREASGEVNERQAAAIAQMPEKARAVVEAMTKAVDRTGRYTDAVRDWVANGADSRFVLSPEEVVARSRPRPMEFGLAAAHFELGQHLHRNGFPLDAVPHFREAHRLDPENWSYPRDAMSLVDPSWGKVYDRDLLSEVAEIGPATFYPPLDM
jgi:hypothetical protein